MKANEIVVGGTYEAVVNNRLTTVYVEKINTEADVVTWTVVSNTTNRRTTFKDVSRFRKVVSVPAPVVEEVKPVEVTVVPTTQNTPVAAVVSPTTVTVVGPVRSFEERFPELTTKAKAEAERRASERQPEESRVASQIIGPVRTTPVNRISSFVNSGVMPVPEMIPHLIVEARAGSGKTTTLIEGIRIVMGHEPRITPSVQQKLVWEAMELSRGKTPNGVCFVAFNKSIATELQSRVPTGCDAMTMHSMGFKALMRQYGNLKVESYRVQSIISELLERDIRDLWKEKPTVIQATEKLVGLCKMNLVGIGTDTNLAFDHEELDELVAHYDIDMNGDRAEVYNLVPLVLNRCVEVTRDRMIDFNDMIWLPTVMSLPIRRYSLLLVDEGQDLNRCQQALAKRAGNRLILCGDPKQAIYGFAGADAESMPRMGRELNETPAGCVTLPLTVTRRCGKAIVAEAQQIVSDFEAFETNPVGEVKMAVYDPKSDKDYSRDVQDGDFILCRVNAPLVSQCFRFLKMGRKANIQGRDIGQGLISLVKKMKADTVLELVGKLDDYFDKEEKKENAKKFPSEARLIALEDRRSCLMFFCEGETYTNSVIARIESIFTDDKTTRGIKLSSIHKAKGLESHRVFFINTKDAPCPHPMAKTAWQHEQEMNLKYVGITRAISELVWVC